MNAANGELDVDSGLNEIDVSLVQKVLKFLETGVFENKNNQVFVNCYT